MIRLENADLSVDLLDPAADVARQGTRYCWGGYIWQVADRRRGPLTSGPEWPHPTPTAFNGQGLPESFRHTTRDGRRLTWQGRDGLGIGIGALRLDDENNVHLARPCRWTVEQREHQAVFTTRDEAAGISYDLERRIVLNGRTLRSCTRFQLASASPLEFQWFAHPFFPLRDESVEVSLPEGCALPVNPGFELQGTRLSSRRRFGPDDRGEFVLLSLPPPRPFDAWVHPGTHGEVRFSTDFPPDECPVWANGATFSLEPYRYLRAELGRPLTWECRFTF